jgi:hypothetical protein
LNKTKHTKKWSKFEQSIYLFTVKFGHSKIGFLAIFGSFTPILFHFCSATPLPPMIIYSKIHFLWPISNAKMNCSKMSRPKIGRAAKKCAKSPLVTQIELSTHPNSNVNILLCFNLKHSNLIKFWLRNRRRAPLSNKQNFILYKWMWICHSNKLFWQSQKPIQESRQNDQNPPTFSPHHFPRIIPMHFGRHLAFLQWVLFLPQGQLEVVKIINQKVNQFWWF